MSEGWGRPSVLDELYRFSAVLLKCCTDRYSQEEYTRKKMSMVEIIYR